MIRFAALGDSVTSGFGDPMPGGGWRGWAVLLAEALDHDRATRPYEHGGPDDNAGPGGGVRPDGRPGAGRRVELHNLAVSGARIADVAERQLPVALTLRPELASVLVGMNDTLRGDFDAGALGRTLTGVVGALTANGATVLTARLPDPGRMFGLPGALARPLGRRMAALNAVLDEIAAGHGTLHVDLAGPPGDDATVYARTNWSVDRLHPSERGHRLLAYRFALALRDAGHPVPRLPGLAATNPEPTVGQRVRWMATQGSRWLLRRSTDLVPSLTRLVAAELLDGLRRPAGRTAGAVPADVGDRLRHAERPGLTR
ncbi:SGNH/GDSL hydrolase family protein [Micromonospora sp. NPDC049559]|uniref:SGNH/GDSL hydrolase family protein n=1 Tax=Micromonospora sp. NPDC049559 TaxID=3155923 RepID=UPI00341EC3EA